MKSLPAVNIQFPISRAILDGTKVIETRTYPLPSHYVGKEMFLVETPGKNGDFAARIVAIIRFGESFKYESAAAFYRDSKRHLVSPDSPWAWDKPKWGWPIVHVETYEAKIPRQVRRGIVFTNELRA